MPVNATIANLECDFAITGDVLIYFDKEQTGKHYGHLLFNTAFVPSTTSKIVFPKKQIDVLCDSIKYVYFVYYICLFILFVYFALFLQRNQKSLLLRNKLMFRGSF
jgi:hypothetical protein